jgi:hypothetical protein
MAASFLGSSASTSDDVSFSSFVDAAGKLKESERGNMMLAMSKGVIGARNMGGTSHEWGGYVTVEGLTI